jgi:phage protein D
MTLEALAKENLNFYAPRFEVEIGGKKLGVNVSKEIIDLEVNERLDEGASFKLTLHDKFDMETQKFKWIDHSLFDFGKKITIKIGYGSNLYTMIKGKITSLEPSFFATETPTLAIGGQDLSFEKMKMASRARTFSNVTYSDIAAMIAQETGLLSIVDPTGKFEPSISKNSNETYYDFLNNIRGKIGFVFDIKGQTMYFVRPGNDEKEILTLELGKDIISFRPTIRTTGLLAKVIVRGHNLRDPTKPIIGEAMAGSETNKKPGKVTGSELANENSKDLKIKEITNVIVNSKEHADAIAKAELIKASDTLIEGEVKCIGLPQVRAGVNIILDKVGNRFSDKYFVIETTHTINDSGYITQFRVKSNSVKKAVT